MLPFVEQSCVSAVLHIPMGCHHERECDVLHNSERVRGPAVHFRVGLTNRSQSTSNHPVVSNLYGN